MPTNCFENIIGLSRTECQCFDNNKPVDYNTSESGYYLDEIEGLNLDMLSAIADCETGNLWELMSWSRDESIKGFKTDLLNAIMMRTKLKRVPYRGVIGDQSQSKAIDVNGDYAGLRMFCADMLSGRMRVKRIGTYFTSGGTVNLQVYNNEDDLPLYTNSFVTQGMKLTWHTLATPIELPMSTETFTNCEYWFLAVNNPLNKPRDNKYTCSCGSAPSYSARIWNTSLMNWNYISDVRYQWLNYVMITGTEGDITSVDERLSWGTINRNYGIFLDVDFDCKVEETLCKGQINYDSNPLAQVMAVAVRYKAGQLLIEKILSTGILNRYTMSDRERLLNKKSTYQKEYNDRITYLAEQIAKPENINAISDCFSCYDESGFAKVGLFT
jgi:hypothetical protein